MDKEHEWWEWQKNIEFTGWNELTLIKASWSVTIFFLGSHFGDGSGNGAVVKNSWQDHHIGSVWPTSSCWSCHCQTNSLWDENKTQDACLGAMRTTSKEKGRTREPFIGPPTEVPFHRLSAMGCLPSWRELFHFLCRSIFCHLQLFILSLPHRMYLAIP